MQPDRRTQRHSPRDVLCTSMLFACGAALRVRLGMVELRYLAARIVAYDSHQAHSICATLSFDIISRKSVAYWESGVVRLVEAVV